MQRAEQWHGGAIREDHERDYVAFMPKPDAAIAVRNLAVAFEHYGDRHSITEKAQ
jgi:hypothetical protein